jgi:hypothetical protein
MEKYKELYDLSREAVAQAEARFDAIETKASIYLSVLTVLVGTAGFFAKWAADHLLPPVGALSWLLVVFAGATVSCVAAAWFLVLQVLRVHRIRVLPLDDATLAFFRHNKLVDIYYALARDFAEAWQTNTGVNERKLQKLTFAYRMIMVTIVVSLVFGFLYAVRAWLHGAL